MKECENCKSEHDESYGSGRFCSSKCARGFSTKEKRKEINEKVSKTITGSKLPKRYTSKEMLTKIRIKRRKLFDDKILSEDFESLTYDRLKRRVILEQNGCCNKCKLSEWLGNEIPLELEHIDGNHHNNERSNVEVLCPNCHALTPTWRGRNKRKIKNRITDDELLESLIENNFNMRQALLQVGMVAKGGNYKRCHKLKREYDELE